MCKYFGWDEDSEQINTIKTLLKKQRKEAYFEGCRDGMSNEQIITLSNEIKKDLINQILSEAPDNQNCYEGCDKQWRELLTKHLI